MKEIAPSPSPSPPLPPFPPSHPSRVMLPGSGEVLSRVVNRCILPAGLLIAEREPIALNVSYQIAPERDTDALSCRAVGCSSWT